MTVKMFYGFLILVICIAIVAIVLTSCIAYHKGMKDSLKENHGGVVTGTISEQELQDLVMKSINNEEKSFVDLVQECIEGKHDTDPKMENTEYVEVSAPCAGYNCAASPNREDCCHFMGNDGMCHMVININKICGIEDTVSEIKKKPDILTPEMINDLANALAEYEKLQNKGA